MAIVRAVSNTLTLSAFYQQYCAKLSLEIFISQTRHFRQAVLDDIVIKNDNHAICAALLFVELLSYFMSHFFYLPNRENVFREILCTGN